MMERRSFMGTVVGMLLAAPFPVCAQQAQKVYTIGSLRIGTLPLPKSFWDAMRGLGWVEGQNVKIEPRYASHWDQLPALAAELVRLKVDLILTYGTPAAGAARRATSSIPIVFSLEFDPVEDGLVSTLAEPGGNLTGVFAGSYEEKQLQILKEVLPALSRVAYPFLRDPIEAIARAAKVLGIQDQGISVLKDPGDFGTFFAAAKKAGANAVLVPVFGVFVPQLERIGAETLKNRLPAIGPQRSFADGGGLLVYGPTPNFEGPYLAAHVDKIFRGAKPADLPIQQPTKFELVINMRTAKALGITIPASLLTRADEVIR